MGVRLSPSCHETIFANEASRQNVSVFATVVYFLSTRQNFAVAVTEPEMFISERRTRRNGTNKRDTVQLAGGLADHHATSPSMLFEQRQLAVSMIMYVTDIGYLSTGDIEGPALKGLNPANQSNLTDTPLRQGRRYLKHLSTHIGICCAIGNA